MKTIKEALKTIKSDAGKLEKWVIIVRYNNVIEVYQETTSLIDGVKAYILHGTIKCVNVDCFKIDNVTIITQ